MGVVWCGDCVVRCGETHLDRSEVDMSRDNEYSVCTIVSHVIIVHTAKAAHPHAWGDMQ